MFINGTPSSPAARVALRASKSRSAKVFASQPKPSAPSSSGRHHAEDMHQSGRPALRTCEEAYVEYCKRFNSKDSTADGTICGLGREDLRLRDVLRSKRASLRCTRCGSNDTRHISFAAKDDPNAWYTKCVDCSNAAEANGDSIGPFSIYEGEPRFEQRTWFPYTDNEKAQLGNAKRQSRSLTATPSKGPSRGFAPSDPPARNSVSRSVGTSRSSSAGSARTPTHANDLRTINVSPSRPPTVAPAGSTRSIEELRDKPVNAMTDDEVFKVVTDYLRREGLIPLPSPSPAPYLDSPRGSIRAEPSPVTSPTTSPSPSASRAPGKGRTVIPSAPASLASPRTSPSPSSSRAPGKEAVLAATTPSAGSKSIPASSSSRAAGKQRSLTSPGRHDSAVYLTTQTTSAKRRKVNVHVELLNRSYYRFVATLCNGRLAWEEFKGQSTLHHLFMFRQYGLEIFDSWFQHWRQMGTTTTIRVLPDQTTVFARIVYARALSLQDPIVISSDSEPESAPTGPSGAGSARAPRAGSVSGIFSETEDDGQHAALSGTGPARKRRRNAGNASSAAKRRKVSSP